MKQSRCVGLLGGVGVGASVHYYRELAKAAERRGVALDLVMIHIEMSHTLAMVRAGDRRALAEYLNGIFLRMRAAGAEVAVIPSVTTHFAMAELASMESLPAIDLFPPLSREIERRGIKRVSLFGTKFVMESQLYGRVTSVDLCPRGRMRRSSSMRPTCGWRSMDMGLRNSTTGCGRWRSS